MIPIEVTGAAGKTYWEYERRGQKVRVRRKGEQRSNLLPLVEDDDSLALAVAVEFIVRKVEKDVARSERRRELGA